MTFYVALLLGLASSGHCFAMCGGLVSALSGARNNNKKNNFAEELETKSIQQALIFEEQKPFFARIVKKHYPGFVQMFMLNAGRICTYAIFALILTGLVKSLGTTIDIPEWAYVLRILTGVALIIAGLQIGFKISLLAPLEKKGECLFSTLKTPMQRLLPKNTPIAYFGLGLYWGFLPCGIVYSVLLLASSSSSYSSASLTVLGFGLGTIPMLLVTGVFANELHQLMHRYQLKKALGCMVVASGCWLMVAPFFMSYFMHGQGASSEMIFHCHT